MVYTKKINAETRAYLKYLWEDKIVPIRKIIKKTGVSRASIYRLRNDNFVTKKKHINEACKRGRPRKLSKRTERKLIRSIASLREEEGNFCVGRLMEKAGVDLKEATVRTVRRVLNRNGYYYLQCRRKGLMTKQDLRKRLKFAKTVMKERPADFWTSQIAFYLDGVSFYYKRNPFGQARTPTGRNWRQKKEGLIQGCTTKGRKEGSGGKVLKLMVAISYRKGVILCEEYDKMDGAHFAKFVSDHFENMFQNSAKSCRLFVQDNDPTQNCAKVRKVLTKKKGILFQIPARSPDINPIENVFHSVKKTLRKQALEQNIKRETYKQFADRVIETFYNFSVGHIDRTIASINGRLKLIIASKVERTKY